MLQRLCVGVAVATMRSGASYPTHKAGRSQTRVASWHAWPPAAFFPSFLQTNKVHIIQNLQTDSHD